MPSLGFSEAVTATKTTVSPYLIITEPLASSATLPISTESFLPASIVEYVR